MVMPAHAQDPWNREPAPPFHGQTATADLDNTVRQRRFTVVNVSMIEKLRIFFIKYDYCALMPGNQAFRSRCSELNVCINRNADSTLQH